MPLSDDQVIALLKKKQAGRTNRKFATELGVSAAYLGDIYLGNRHVGPTVLAALGLKKITVIVPIEKNQTA